MLGLLFLQSRARKKYADEVVHPPAAKKRDGPAVSATVETAGPASSVFAGLSDEIQWEGDRILMVESALRLYHPVAYSKIERRSDELYSKLSDLGVKAPRYWHPLRRGFFVDLYHLSTEGKLGEARALFDRLSASTERQE